VTSLPTPEVFAEDPGGSVTQAVGILLTAAAAFGVAAFSPLLVTKLLPLTEAAVVGQGIRSGPIRAGHQGLMMANTAQMMSARLNQVASARPGHAPGGAAGGAGSAAGAAGSAAAGGGPAVGATAAAAVASVPVRAAQRSAAAAGQPSQGPGAAQPPGGLRSGGGGDDG
jgi:hypothetical protein